MKKLTRVFALILALMLAAACFAEEETATPAEERTVLMTVGGMPVYQDEAEQIAYLLYYYGSTEDSSIINGVNYILYYEIAPMLLTEGKVEELVGKENIESLTEAYKAQYRAELEDYASYNLAEDTTEEDRAAAIAQAEATYLEQGITEENYVNEQIALDAFNVVLEGFDCTVTDEEVQAYYDSIAAQDEAYLGNDIQMYEYYAFMYGYDVFFRPEGYRGVLHILLGADEELLTAYKEAEGDEAKAEAAAAIIAFNQETIDAIYADLDAGASFEEEIAKYNTDPGMTDANNLANGYAVHAKSIYMVPEFVTGAFADEMQKPGDVGLPVVSDYGVHILYYLCDLPAGVLPMTDDVKANIGSMLSASKQQTAIADALEQFEVVYYDAYETQVGEKNLLEY